MSRIIVTVSGVITNYLSATTQFVEQIILNKFMATSGIMFCLDIQMRMTNSGGHSNFFWVEIA